MTGLLFRTLQLCLLAVPLLATGCTAVAISAFDAVMSDQNNADCAVSRIVRGEKMCLAEAEPVPTKVHCYRTLGRVECYEEEDPYFQGDGVYSKRRPDVADTAVEMKNNGEDESLLVGKRSQMRVIEAMNAPPEGTVPVKAEDGEAPAAQQRQIQPINSPPPQ